MKTNLNNSNVILNASEGSNSNCHTQFPWCHTRLDRVSMDSRIQSENDKMETGRSMVEMLGVLAVIGVLSIGGIAGYTTAMNKHRANDILNAASQRAMVVSAQIQRDANTTPSLAEFSSSNTVNEATFDESVTYTGSSTTTFALSLTGLGSDNAICTQMKNIAGTDGNVNVSDDCGTLTYNVDLSNGVTPAATAPTGNECTATSGCEGGATCKNGYCECSNGGMWQPSGVGTGSCNTGITGCKNNDACKTIDPTSCGNGECYCAISTANNQTQNPTTGTCTPKGNLPDGIEYNDNTFYKGEKMTSWWSARNWCLAQGKSLATKSSLGLTASSYNVSNGPIQNKFGNIVYLWLGDVGDFYPLSLHIYSDAVILDDTYPYYMNTGYVFCKD